MSGTAVGLNLISLYYLRFESLFPNLAIVFSLLYIIIAITPNASLLGLVASVEVPILVELFRKLASVSLETSSVFIFFKLSVLLWVYLVIFRFGSLVV